jgi:hypothetical protein
MRDHATAHAMLTPDMRCHWDGLPDELQLALSRAALHYAAEMIAGQAETLAAEMTDGTVGDRGGPDALRLLATIIRMTGRDDIAPAGHA